MLLVKKPTNYATAQEYFKMKKPRKIKTINTHGVKGYSVALLNKTAAIATHERQIKNSKKGA